MRIHLLDRHDIAQPARYPVGEPAVLPAAGLQPASTSTSASLPRASISAGCRIRTSTASTSTATSTATPTTTRATSSSSIARGTWPRPRSLPGPRAWMTSRRQPERAPPAPAIKASWTTHDPHLDYGPRTSMLPYRFVASYVYQLPFGRGKKFASGHQPGRR